MFANIEIAKMEPLEGVRTNYQLTGSKLSAVPLDPGAIVKMSAKGEGVIEVPGEGVPTSEVFTVGLLPVVHVDDKATMAVPMEGEIANQVPVESTKISGLFAENGLSKIFQELNLSVEVSAECEKTSAVTEEIVLSSVMVSVPKDIAVPVEMSTDEGVIGKELGDIAIINGIGAECPFTAAATKVPAECESATKIDVVINSGMTEEKPSETTAAKRTSAGCEVTTEMSREVEKTSMHPSIEVTMKIFADGVLANKTAREPITTNEVTEVPTDITPTMEISAEDEKVKDVSGENVATDMIASLHPCVPLLMEISAGEITSDGSAEDLTTNEMPTKMSVEDKAVVENEGLKNNMISSVPPDNTTIVVSSDHEMLAELPGECMKISENTEVPSDVLTPMENISECEIFTELPRAVVTTSEFAEEPLDVPVAMEISADCMIPNKVSEEVETTNAVVSVYPDKTVNDVLGESVAINEVVQEAPESTATNEMSVDNEIFAGLSGGGVSNGDTAKTLRISANLIVNEVADVGTTSGVTNVSPNTIAEKSEEREIICDEFRESVTSSMTEEPPTTAMDIPSDVLTELSRDVMTSGVAEVPLHTAMTLEMTGEVGLTKKEFGEGLTTNVQVSVHPVFAVTKEMTAITPDTTEIVQISSYAKSGEDVATNGMTEVPLDPATRESEIANVSEAGGTTHRVADVSLGPATMDTSAECLTANLMSGKADGIANRPPDTTPIEEMSEIVELCGKTMLIGEIPEVPTDVSASLGRSSEIVMTELPDECSDTRATTDSCEGTTTTEISSDGIVIAESFGECVTSTVTDGTPYAPVTTVISAGSVMVDHMSEEVEGMNALAFIPSDTFTGDMSAGCVIPNEMSGEVGTTDGAPQMTPGTAARLQMSAEGYVSNKAAGEDTITNEVAELLPDSAVSAIAKDSLGNNVTTSLLAGVPSDATATMDMSPEGERATEVSGENVATSRVTEALPDMTTTMKTTVVGGIATDVSENEVVTNAMPEVPQGPTAFVGLSGGGGTGNEVSEVGGVDIEESGEDVTTIVVSEVLPDSGVTSVKSAECVIATEMVSVYLDIPRSGPGVVADVVSIETETKKEVAEIPRDTTTCGEVLAKGDILNEDSGEDVGSNGLAKLLLGTTGALDTSVECEMSGEGLTSEMKEVTPAITASMEISSDLSGESVTAIGITEVAPSTIEIMETAVDDKIINHVPAEDVRANGMAEVHLQPTTTMEMFAEGEIVSDVSGERVTINEMIELPTAIAAAMEVSSYPVALSDLSGEGMTICRVTEAPPDTTRIMEMVAEDEMATEASGEGDAITHEVAEMPPGTATMEISSGDATITEPFEECVTTSTATDVTPVTMVISAGGVMADQMSEEVEGMNALALIPSDTFTGDMSAGCVILNEMSGEVGKTDGITAVIPPGTAARLQVSAEGHVSNKAAGEDTITNEVAELLPDTTVSESKSAEGIIANGGYQWETSIEKPEVPADRVTAVMSDKGEMLNALPGQVIKTSWMTKALPDQTTATAMSTEGVVASRRSGESATNVIAEVPSDFLPTTMEMSAESQISSELSAEDVPNREVISVYPGVTATKDNSSEGVKVNEMSREGIQTNGLAEMEMTAEADIATEILGASVATTGLAEDTGAVKDMSEEVEMFIDRPEVAEITEVAEKPSDLTVSWELAAGSIVRREMSGKSAAIIALASVCLGVMGTMQLPAEGEIVNKVSGAVTTHRVTDVPPDAAVAMFAESDPAEESVTSNEIKELLNVAVAMETSREGAVPNKVSEDMVTSEVTEASPDVTGPMEMAVDSVVTNNLSENVTPSEMASGLRCAAILSKEISVEGVEVEDVSEEGVTTTGMTKMPPDATSSIERSAEGEGDAAIPECIANNGVTEVSLVSASTLGNSAEGQIPIEPSGELVLTSGVVEVLPDIAESLEMAAGGMIANEMSGEGVAIDALVHSGWTVATELSTESEGADEMPLENEMANQAHPNTGAIPEISSESERNTTLGTAEQLPDVTAEMEISAPCVIDNEVSEKHVVSFGQPGAVALEDEEISSEDLKANNQSGEGATSNAVVEMPQDATATTETPRQDEEAIEISEKGVVINRLPGAPTPAATATTQMSTKGDLDGETSDKDVATRNVASEQPGVLVAKGIAPTGVEANETLTDDVRTDGVTEVPPDTAVTLETSAEGVVEANKVSETDGATHAMLEIPPGVTATTEIIPDVEIANEVPEEDARNNEVFAESMWAKAFPDTAVTMETFAQNVIFKPVPVECPSASEVTSQMPSDILLPNNTEVEVMAKIKGAKLVSEGLAAIMLNQMPSGGRSADNRSRKRKASESLAEVCAYRPNNALCCAGHWCTAMKVTEHELHSVSVKSTDHTSIFVQSKEQQVNRVGNEHSPTAPDRNMGAFGAVEYHRVDKDQTLCYRRTGLRSTIKENDSILKLGELNSAVLLAHCNPLYSKLQLIDSTAVRFDCCSRDDPKYDTSDVGERVLQLGETKPENIPVNAVNAPVFSELSGELVPIEKLATSAGNMVSAKCVKMEPASLQKLEMLQAVDMCSIFQAPEWMDQNFCLNTELKSCWNSTCMPNLSQDQCGVPTKLQPLTWSSRNYLVPRNNHTHFVTPIFPVSSGVKLAPIFSSLTISDEAMEQCISRRTDWCTLPGYSSEDAWAILQWLNGFGKNSWPLSTLCKTRMCTCNRSKFGLPTILALSSPGCYRVWTRRRRLGSKIPTVQRLFLTRFEEHLKGLNIPVPLDKLFPSMPCSLGRIVSWWNQHGPSFASSTGSTNNCKRMSMGTSPSYFLSNLVTKNGTNFSGTKPLLFLQTSERIEVRPLDLRELCPAVSDLPTSPAECTVTDLSIFPAALPPAPSVENQLCSEQKEVCAPPDETKRKPKGSTRKVSQIRIRKTIPKQDTNLTPMGLPKPKRLKKKEFSLEEIYTNKNYKSPSANSKYLETIFEEPVLKKGSFVCTSLQKRKRLLEFQDYTLPRKRRAHSGVKVPSRTRRRKPSPREGEIDSLLIQKLTELEAFLSGED
ncbi:uncharacterized protein wu:fi75a02 [Callorhinchus milii]|uniref:uncharacterized protein wu:fi75a02 n=1 Tax=Callorhinchus milii TaxID=7868 RepID=UPI001C3F5F0E|nr:uncharacterized protein wu:fi75a02 [Callorhinchus milii]XP_042193084.1 uncharacterized protein wu:fi75a02 [Callorhinchus milii]